MTVAVRRIAFYTRISTNETLQEHSLPAQRQDLERYCKATYGDRWRLHRVFTDEASGARLKRPGLTEVLAEADLRAFDVLMVVRIDRLARSSAHLTTILDRLSAGGVALVSATEPFDTSQASGRLAVRILGIFAEFEHALISSRVRSSFPGRIARGRTAHMSICYGYRVGADGRLEVVPEEAEVVREIFIRYLDRNEGAGVIARRLEARRIKPIAGPSWDPSGIRGILRNPTYGGRSRICGKPSPYEHEPIVPMEYVERAKALMKGRVRRDRAPRIADRHLLAGIIICGRCGGRFRGMPGTRRRRSRYECATHRVKGTCGQQSITGHSLERELVRWVSILFGDAVFVKRVHREARRLVKHDVARLERELRSCRARTKKAETALRKVHRSFERGRIQAKACHRQAEKLGSELAQLEAERDRLTAELARTSVPPVDMKALTAAIGQFRQVFADIGLPAEVRRAESGRDKAKASGNKEKKLWIRRFVERVVVGPGRAVSVWFRLPVAATYYGDPSCRCADLLSEARKAKEQGAKACPPQPSGRRQAEAPQGRKSAGRAGGRRAGPPNGREVFVRARCRFADNVLRGEDGPVAVCMAGPGGPVGVVSNTVELPVEVNLHEASKRAALLQGSR